MTALAHVLTIDPGTTSGWSRCVNGRLHGCGAFEFGTAWPDTFLPQWEQDQFGWGPSFKWPLVVIEKPQWRKSDHAIDVNDIIELALMAGEFRRFYRGLGHEVEMPWPTTWKGSVPKDIHNARVLRALTEDELALVPVKPRARKHRYDHNMIDAIGMNLWKNGRIR